MRTSIFFILLVISLNGLALTWKKVAENEVGNYYIDFDSVKKRDGLVFYTDLVDFNEPYKNDQSAISSYAIDCEKEEQKWLSLTTYSKRMGNGVVNSRSKPNEIIYPQANTIYFFIIKNICNLKR
tara:strand:- start:295 stop:669 length:375 start_codon:yes stop_codon:yes gene_type:complete